MAGNRGHSLWNSVLGNLQLQVPRPSFDTWLKDTVGFPGEDGSFVVCTPSPFVAEMLERRMYCLIGDALEKITGARPEVRFTVAYSPDTTRADDPDPAHQAVGPSGDSPRIAHQTHLNGSFTFGTFVVGKSNELAHAASMAVAAGPGHSYNPLVIYSDVGLGKTHLLHAIGHRLRNQGQKVAYRTTEEFTNEYISAIRGSSTDNFREFYRGADALLLDDIQFIIGKEQTQEGFFHTFNSLHMANRQVVIASDRPVGSLTLLEDRMKSRLSGGLVVDIQAPDPETRRAILKTKADRSEASFPDEVVDYLAAHDYSSIRALDGHLNRITAFAELLSQPVTLELVRRATADMTLRHVTRQITADQVIEQVCGYFGVERAAVMGRRRDRPTALARQIAMYLAKHDSGMGLTVIGKVMGGRDHSTVSYACSRIAKRVTHDVALEQDIANIRRSLETLAIAA